MAPRPVAPITLPQGPNRTAGAFPMLLVGGDRNSGACRAPVRPPRWVCRAVPLSCEKGPHLSDKAGAAPAARTAIWPPSPSQPSLEAGVLHGMNLIPDYSGFTMSFLTQASTHGPPGGGGPPLHLPGPEANPSEAAGMKVPGGGWVGLQNSFHYLWGGLGRGWGVAPGSSACSPEPSTKSRSLKLAEAARSS